MPQKLTKNPKKYLYNEHIQNSLDAKHRYYKSNETISIVLFSIQQGTKKRRRQKTHVKIGNENEKPFAQNLHCRFYNKNTLYNIYRHRSR